MTIPLRSIRTNKRETVHHSYTINYKLLLSQVCTISHYNCTRSKTNNSRLPFPEQTCNKLNAKTITVLNYHMPSIFHPCCRKHFSKQQVNYNKGHFSNWNKSSWHFIASTAALQKCFISSTETSDHHFIWASSAFGKSIRKIYFQHISALPVMTRPPLRFSRMDYSKLFHNSESRQRCQFSDHFRLMMPERKSINEQKGLKWVILS